MILRLDEPNPKQRLFMTAEQRYVAYGGARGGGKSHAIRQKAALLALNYAGIRILILRRTYAELRENHILPMCQMLMGIAVYKDTDKSMIFPNKSRIVFGYCDSEADTLRYQGQEYDIIFIDEATQLTELQFKWLTGSIRGVNDFPKRCYLSCNPGGVGHAWVKRLFIDREYLEGENPDDYVFISARVTDNKALMESDPQYIKSLEALPEDLKRAWLEGDWDALAGQYFGEFRKDKHTCEPFEIPKSWRRYFAMDYGLDMLAGYWAAFSPDGKCYIYREVYQSDLIVKEAAEEIRRLSEGEEIFAYLAPVDLWGRSADTGKSQAESFSDNGLYLSQVIARSRVDGWMDVKSWLKSENIKIFSTCTNLIRCLPLLQHDTHRPNDCAIQPHEITHAPDALRYMLAGRPVAEPIKEIKKEALPFALRDDKKEGGFIEW